MHYLYVNFQLHLFKTNLKKNIYNNIIDFFINLYFIIEKVLYF